MVCDSQNEIGFNISKVRNSEKRGRDLKKLNRVHYFEDHSFRKMIRTSVSLLE